MKAGSTFRLIMCTVFVLQFLMHTKGQDTHKDFKWDPKEPDEATLHILKSSPPKFIYFSKDEPNRPLTRDQFQKLHPEPNQKIGAYCHGWNTKSLEKAGSFQMKDALFDSKDNLDAVVVMDWSKESRSGYPTAVSNFRSQSESLAKEFRHWNTPPSQVQFHGHSLGAHIIGHAARLISSKSGQKISKAVGYDPAGPGNFRIPPDFGGGLTPDVAAEVITLNTNRNLGAWRDLGTQNIYVDDHPSLKNCYIGAFGASCKHSAARDIGEQMLRGELPWANMTREGQSQALDSSENSSLAPQKKRIKALVLDISPSMQKYGRIQSLVASANGLVSSIPINSTSLAVIVFGGSAHLKFGPTVITTEEVRQGALRSLPSVRDEIGWTSIGAGLQKAVDLSQNGEIPLDIILISDGDENTSPYAKDVVIPPCATVHPVAFSEQADKKLEELAERTGGQAHFLGDQDSLKNLPGMLSDIFYDGQEYQTEAEDNFKPVRLISKPVTSLEKEVSFNLDRDLGKDLQVTVLPLENQLKNNLGKVSLWEPSGTEVEGVVDTFGRKLFNFEGLAPEGEWKLKFNDAGNERRRRRRREVERKLGVVEVKSFPKEGEHVQPVTLEAKLSNSTMADGQPIVVSAVVKKGSKFSVLGAEVVATVKDWRDREVTQLELKDDGVGVDELGGDGVYSRALWEELGLNQRFQVVVTAKCEGTECFIVDSETQIMTGLLKVSGSPEVKQLGYGFEREVNAGSVKYTTELQNQFEQKPSSIDDLSVTQVDFQERKLSLQWTNPGAYGGEGNVSKLELLLMTSLKDGARPEWIWSSADDDNETVLELGPPGSEGLAEIQIPEEIWEEWGTLYEKVFVFRMFAENSEGLKDEGSNLLLAVCKEEGHGNLYWFLVAVGALLVPFGVGALVYWWRR